MNQKCIICNSYIDHFHSHGDIIKSVKYFLWFVYGTKSITDSPEIRQKEKFHFILLYLVINSFFCIMSSFKAFPCILWPCSIPSASCLLYMYLHKRINIILKYPYSCCFDSSSTISNYIVVYIIVYEKWTMMICIVKKLPISDMYKHIVFAIHAHVHVSVLEI